MVNCNNYQSWKLTKIRNKKLIATVQSPGPVWNNIDLPYGLYRVAKLIITLSRKLQASMFNHWSSSQLTSRNWNCFQQKLSSVCHVFRPRKSILYYLEVQYNVSTTRLFRIRGNMLHFLSNFLSHRSIKVRIGNSYSRHAYWKMELHKVVYWVYANSITSDIYATINFRLFAHDLCSF